MSWIDDLANITDTVSVHAGVIDTSDGTLRVIHKGTSVSAARGSVFDAILAARGLTGVHGLKVLYLIPDGQPFISDLILGS